jgi:hypothetical protein
VAHQYTLLGKQLCEDENSPGGKYLLRTFRSDILADYGLSIQSFQGGEDLHRDVITAMATWYNVAERLMCVVDARLTIRCGDKGEVM